MTAQPTSTVLFSQSDVEALMILGKSPRFEIRAPGREVEVIPATRAWRSEQKLAVERAQALLSVAVAPPLSRLEQALSAFPTLGRGDAKATKRRMVLGVSENPDGSHTLSLRGGKDDKARQAQLRAVGEWVLAAHLNVSFGFSEITVSEPQPGDDCYEDYIELTA
jgi:hypothetical protein